MSPEPMDDPNNSDPNNSDSIQSDPLLQAGAFIDPTPTPTSNGNGTKKLKTEAVETTPQGSDQKSGLSSSAGPVDVTDQANRPDWLPPGWLFKETLRTSGASAGSKDKYFIDPASNRRFRSKKEVFQYLETGTTPKQKRKNADSDAENTQGALQVTETPNKRKKSEAKAKVSMKNFNFDEVPDKVKWDLIDVFEGTWRPLINGVERVPESSKQEWTAAFTYLTLQNAA
ncbi:methyl-CpG-binding domain-containing protein 5-like [Silene latifolia]|uniref:methyl-CpG-binding domain-containing protein 5-like n=1 Tax=Silene latifolia TaxID=37657 RepID=UPI003D77082C